MSIRKVFKYDIAFLPGGAREPYPRMAEGKIAIWLERRVDQIFKKNRKYKVRKKDVHITADRNGLRYLGALFLVAADAEKYDPEWHWHIPLLCRNYGKNVKTNVDLTIHAPHAYKGVCKLLGGKGKGDSALIRKVEKRKNGEKKGRILTY